jgi:hypothetical protein
MNLCRWCGQSVDDLAEHFGSDDCPQIVAAFGSVNHAQELADADEQAPVVRGIRAGVCRVCGLPALKEAYCETHLRACFP